MYEFLILSGISGAVYVFVKSKFNKYEKTIFKERLIFDSEKNSLKDEIAKLNKKLPKKYTKEEQENINTWAIKYEKFICSYYENKGYTLEHRGIKDNKLNNEDAGIDIIATKGEKILLIQCKYWVNKILEHNHIKEIYGNYNFYINKNNLDRKNTDCVIVFPKSNSLSVSAKNILNENKNSCKYEIIPLIKNDFKLILGIIEIENSCWKCNKNTPLIALKFYTSYQYITIEDEMVIYFISELPDDLLKLIQEKYPMYYYKSRKKDNLNYIANNCIHCEFIQDDEHLYEKGHGAFYNVNEIEPKYFIGLNEKTNKLEYIYCENI